MDGFTLFKGKGKEGNHSISSLLIRGKSISIPDFLDLLF